MGKNRISALLTAAFFTIIAICSDASAAEGELIQMAILLDTSNSMDGLINQAKTTLWKIVNELAIAKKGGKSPRLEVALYEYGKSSIPAAEGYIRQVTPLTADLDRVSEELFKLTTNGGDEYCGKVIKSATMGLQWSKNNKDLKVIFIAGNEPFTQGDVDYKASVKNTIAKGIIVNTIFCGSYKEGVDTGWKDGADRADGKYMNIDQNQMVADIKAPQDEEIVKLGNELNKTYVAYGATGEKKKMRQSEQDRNASSMNKEAIVQRSVAKASVQYDNASWDLVDAAKNDSSSIEKLKEEELPAEMQKMNKQERKAYVENKLKERDAIQKKINKLNQERRAYVDKEMKKQASQNTLDQAVIKAIRSQAGGKNFIFGEK